MSSVEDEGPESTKTSSTMVVEESCRQGDDDLESVKLITEVMLEGDIHQDPAILLMGPANPKPDKYVYSYDVLIKLRQSPFSTKRPDYLDTAHDNNGTWDPERWHMERKASEAPTENGNRNGNGPGNPTDLENHRRRSGDPKDRLRREHDGIVLSPQRRSFNSGCFVPVREPTRNNRSHSPLGGKGTDPPGHIGHREISQGPTTRRIGSGRILPWDYQEKNDIDNDFGYRRERRDTDRDRERDERFERRSFSRDDPPGPRQPKGPKDSISGPFNRNNNRYDRRRVSENKEEEPEWFSEGPISQHDTIELRGFDDSEKINKKKPGSQRKKARDKERLINRYGSQKPDEQSSTEIGGSVNKTNNNNNKDVQQQQQPEIVDKEVVPQADRTSSGGGVNKDGVNKEKTTTTIQVVPINATTTTKPDSDDFNLDDFLKSDIPSILRNGIENQSSGSSKFSQWFKRESPVKNSNQSSNSSMEDDQNHVINTILNDITESTVNIPGDAESYFAPISPAANTAPSGVPSQTFMEMLHKSKHQHQHHQRNSQGKNVDIPAKMLILEELEAKIRKAEIGPAGDMRAAHQNVTSESDENAAFKKLLAQVNAGNLSLASNGPTAKAPPQGMSLMEMLSHSQKQDEAARMIQMMGASGLLPNEIYKHQQQGQQQQQQQRQQQHQHQQMEALVKLMGAQMRQQPRTPPLNDIGIQAASRELLNRPEAQAIFQGLNRGDITPQNLYQQLANPAMQSRHRELLQMILKTLPGQAPGPSPRVLSPMAPQTQQQHAAFTQQQQQQQQQQLRVSPLPPVNALHQRIPSPRELQLHTQHIMHNALIKKKLEEQSENFRKKQESQQRAQQGGGGGGGSIAPPSKNVASPTQLAWGTPTSVLRKMTADKDDGKDANKNDPNKLVQQQQQQQQGRPLTGMRQTQPTPQQQWNAQYNPQMNNKGRAIVKNNANYQQVQQQQHDQYMLQQRMFNQQHPHQQQQQQRKQTQQQQYANMQFGGSGIPQGFGGQTGQFNHQQLRAQHQARAQHQHQAQPQQQQPQQQQSQQQQQQSQQSQQQQQYSQQQHQWMLQNQNFDTRQQVIGGNRSGTTDGGEMSPTSNQLARWFSSDLLDRARKGKLPTMPPNLAQHALSLEEIERQATPAVHN